MIPTKRIGRFEIRTFEEGTFWLSLHYNASTSVILHGQPDDLLDLEYAIQCIKRDAATSLGKEVRP